MKMNDNENDSFFQPRDLDFRIQKRDEELKRAYDEILHKIELGLKKVKIEYECNNCEEKTERTFLCSVSKLHWEKDLRYTTRYIDLKNDMNILKGFFDLEGKEFYININKEISERCFYKMEYRWEPSRIFMNEMIRKYFDLHDFSFLRD